MYEKRFGATASANPRQQGAARLIDDAKLTETVYQQHLRGRSRGHFADDCGLRAEGVPAHFVHRSFSTFRADNRD